MKKINFKYMGTSHQIHIKPYLSINEMVVFVDSVLNMTFYNIDDKLLYRPELFELAFKYSVIISYADIELPKSSDEVWDILNKTNLYKNISNKIGKKQIEKLERIARQSIKEKRNAILKTDPLSDFGKALVEITTMIQDYLHLSDDKAITDFLNKLKNEALSEIEAENIKE